MVIVVMGVSGCGKSSLGRALAEQWHCPFYDGDDFHPAGNIAKMSAGIPLTDADRWPWLTALQEVMAGHVQQGTTAVVACSALKKSYRDLLRQAGAEVYFVYLAGKFDLLWERISTRPGHFMPAQLLQTQLATLEPPTPAEALTLPITLSLAEMITLITQQNWGEFNLMTNGDDNGK